MIDHAGAAEAPPRAPKYMKIGDTYYQPIIKDGKNMYEVVEVK